MPNTRGRPSKGDRHQVTLRIPESLYASLEAHLATEQQKSLFLRDMPMAQYIVGILAQYVEQEGVKK